MLKRGSHPGAPEGAFLATRLRIFLGTHGTVVVEESVLILRKDTLKEFREKSQVV